MLPHDTSSPRAKAVQYRTYLREGETWDDAIHRSTFDHHQRLWADAGGDPDPDELRELEILGQDRRSTVAGRTLWLGGTDYAYSRAACQFNCSYTRVATVYDVVDAAWLLLNGCGVGFKPVVGTLHGYVRRIPEFQVIPTTRDKDYRGPEGNVETLPTASNDWTWTIQVGDSAMAWAKAVGKLVNPSARTAWKLVLDFSNCRGPGGRLKGYGWICNGPGPLAAALTRMHAILNSKAGDLLDELDIMDLINLVGTVLSSRRAAELTVMDATNPRAGEFMRAKGSNLRTHPHRRQSNNSLLFWSKPIRSHLEELIRFAWASGGDPNIINAEAARLKCPWFDGANPCVEIMEASNGFCNVVTNCLPRYRRDFAALERGVHLIARANYRQTCVDLRDQVLQPAWHQTNESLRLCGVSVTGVVQADWITDYQIRRLRNAAVTGAYSMADELRLPRPKAVTTGKPEGTGSKAMGDDDIGEIAEGVHRPLGQWIYNWIVFSKHDPLVPRHEAAGYRVIPNPNDSSEVLICFPVDYRGVQFDQVDGRPVNLESAVSQLNRYLRWNNLWADHNISATINFDESEIPAVAQWMDENWYRGFIAVALMRRINPLLRPQDVGHPYLPQEVVTEESYRGYRESLRPVSYDGLQGAFDVDAGECPGGVCPIR